MRDKPLLHMGKNKQSLPANAGNIVPPETIVKTIDEGLARERKAGQLQILQELLEEVEGISGAIFQPVGGLSNIPYLSKQRVKDLINQKIQEIQDGTK